MRRAAVLALALATLGCDRSPSAAPVQLPQPLAVRPAKAGTFRICLHTSRFTYWLNEDGLNVYIERAPAGKLIIQARVTTGTETTIQGFSPWDVKQEGVLRAVVKPYPGQTFVDGTHPAFLFEGVIE